MKLGYFLLSCLLAFVGGHMLNYSIIFLALEWFESPLLSGVGFALCFGPPIILGWFAGAFCDRYSPRKVILMAQNAYFIAIAILALCLYLEPKNLVIWYLLACFHLGVAWSFVAPARFASLSYYVSKEKLVSATILLNLMVMFGFGLAPILVKSAESMMGWYYVLLISGSCLLLSSIILWLLPYPFKGQIGLSTAKMLSQTKSLLASSLSLKTYLAMATGVYLLMGPIQILLPQLVDNHLELADVEQGLYLSLVAFALIVGGIIALKIKSWFNRPLIISSLIIAGALGFGLLGYIQHLKTSAILLVFSTIAGGAAVSLVVSGLQQAAPEAMRGRVMSAYTVLSQIVPALSGLVAGFASQWFGLQIGLVLFAVAVILTMMLTAIVFRTKSGHYEIKL